ncbi:hypothetical protein B0J11DRAFT_614619 [Dendryphion nanum]|uniref:protein disulfide-isomerase n=1 Tax=Dendryphion nanum TaxID=256645 RepID=A0A9P9IN36_9PLEO|nr:hypothetical protein B0J11DRAFT_614619 [Dendryphion nanum]
MHFPPRFLFYLNLFAHLIAAKLHPSISSPGFTTLLHTNDLVLTLFTSPQDPSLQPLNSIFEFTSLETKIPCAIIDCDIEATLCQNWDVNAYPAIRLFKSQKITVSKDGGDDEGGREEEEEWETQSLRYRGPKTIAGLLSYLKKHTLPLLTHIPPSKLNFFKEIDDIVIIAFLPAPDSTTTTTLLPRFRALAEKYRHQFIFGYVSNAEAVAEDEWVNVPGIKVFRNRDGDHWVLDSGLVGGWEEERLEPLLEGVEKNLIEEFKEKEAEKYMLKTKLTIYIFLPLSPLSPSHNPSLTTSLLQNLTPLAKQFTQYTTFTLIDSEEFLPMAKGFGLSGDTFPALVMHAPMNDQVFLYREGRAIRKEGGEGVEKMLRGVLRGEVKGGTVWGKEVQGGHDEL